MLTWTALMTSTMLAQACATVSLSSSSARVCKYFFITVSAKEKNQNVPSVSWHRFPTTNNHRDAGHSYIPKTCFTSGVTPCREMVAENSSGLNIHENQVGKQNCTHSCTNKASEHSYISAGEGSLCGSQEVCKIVQNRVSPVNRSRRTNLSKLIC